MAGRVGDDAAGRMLLARARARGVRADVGVDPEAPTGTVLVVDGEIRADRGAKPASRRSTCRTLEADAVLVSGYLAGGHGLAALERARAGWIALDAARLDVAPAAGARSCSRTRPRRGG